MKHSDPIRFSDDALALTLAAIVSDGYECTNDTGVGVAFMIAASKPAFDVVVEEMRRLHRSGHISTRTVNVLRCADGSPVYRASVMTIALGVRDSIPVPRVPNLGRACESEIETVLGPYIHSVVVLARRNARSQSNQMHLERLN